MDWQECIQLKSTDWQQSIGHDEEQNELAIQIYGECVVTLPSFRILSENYQFIQYFSLKGQGSKYYVHLDVFKLLRKIRADSNIVEAAPVINAKYSSDSSDYNKPYFEGNTTSSLAFSLDHYGNSQLGIPSQGDTIKKTKFFLRRVGLGSGPRQGPSIVIGTLLKELEKLGRITFLRSDLKCFAIGSFESEEVMRCSLGKTILVDGITFQLETRSERKKYHASPAPS